VSAAPVAPLRVALTALGCKVNFAEMADLAGRLAAAGLEVVPEDEPADVRVLNSCTVTLQADATTRQRLARLRRDDPGCHLVLTGCSVDGNPDRYLGTAPDGGPRQVAGVDAVFSNAQKSSIADYLLALAAPYTGAPPASPPLRSRAFVKVQDGCDHRCTYCSVWRARGKAGSLAVDEVRRRVDAALATGHREVVLCGVDLGWYGRDHDTSLAALLRRLLDGIGTARLRLSSVNANDVDAALVEVAAHPRLCPHWHMPLQSGSDRVLRAMHRGYRRTQYLRVAGELRDRRPETEFTTDVMVGFPGEDATDHAATLQLMDEVGFAAAHVFRYSPRPGTPASALDGPVADAAARQRSREVRRLAARSGAAARQRAVGRSCEVVWERVEGGCARGLSDTYQTVVTGAVRGLRPGGLNLVRIVGVEADTLRGVPATA